MASEYLKWKYRDVKPEKPRELSPKEKRANWWHYYKWWVLGGLTVAAVGVYLLLRWLGVGQVKPDFQVAYVGENALPGDTVAALEWALGGLGVDANQDGSVVVVVDQYLIQNEDAMYSSAEATRLMADLDSCESYYFLLEDPAGFQEKYQVLRRLDGTLPKDTDRDFENCYISWQNCPVLADLELGSYEEKTLGQTTTGDSQQLLSNLYVARRGFWTEKTVDFPSECDQLWEKLTKGAAK